MDIDHVVSELIRNGKEREKASETDQVGAGFFDAGEDKVRECFCGRVVFAGDFVDGEAEVWSGVAGGLCPIGKFLGDGVV